MSKTKLEIINETEVAYSDPANRAADDERCYYLSPSRKMCAVGRCMKKPEVGFFGTPLELKSRKLGIINFEQTLKSEYQGHSVYFWSDLQKFHDRSQHFNKNSISQKGLSYLEALRKQYGQ